MSPGEQDGERGTDNQCPFHRTLHNEQPQNEKEHHEGTHIHRSGSTGLFPPILSQLAIQPHVIRVGLLHGLFIVCQRYGSTSFHIGYQQGESFPDSITPLGDIASFQSAACLVRIVFFHQFALATHGLLAVFIRVIQVRQVHADPYQTRYNQDYCRFDKLRHLLFPPCHHAIGDGHKQHDKQEVITHLRMVGHNLKRDKQSGHDTSRQQFPPISQYHTGNRGRDISQSHKLPDMSGRNDDEEIRRKGPENGTQCRHPHLEIKSPQQDIKAQQHYKHIPHVGRQKEVIHLLNPAQRIGRVVTGRHLIGRHTAKNRIGPPGPLTCLLQVFTHLTSRTDTGHGIVLCQNASFGHCRKEISKRNDSKKNDDYHVGQ